MRLVFWCSAGSGCDTSTYRWHFECIHTLCHLVQAFLILTQEDEYEGVAVFHSGKMGLEDVHAISFDNVVVTEKLCSCEAVFHRLFKQGLLAHLHQYHPNIEQIILAISDSRRVGNSFRHYEDGGIEGDTGRAQWVTKESKEIVSIVHRNLNGRSGRTAGLCNFFLTELFDTFVCCVAVDHPVFRVLETETETGVDVHTVLDEAAIDLGLRVCVAATSRMNGIVRGTRFMSR